MTNEIKKWWNDNSIKYQEDSNIPICSVHYGPYAPNESQLRLLGNVNRKRVLEIGCGGGQCSIALAKQGAKCIGLDISVEQLKFAIKLAERENVRIKFIQGSFQNLKRINSTSQDIVFSAFALQYALNLNRVFSEVYRVLRKNGIFAFSLDHPFYNIFDVEAPRISNGYFRIKQSYFKTGKFVNDWPDSSKRKFVIYKRKVSDLYNGLVSVGFFVEQIIEPFDSKQTLWKEIFPFDLCRLVGPTIIFKSKKI